MTRTQRASSAEVRSSGVDLPPTAVEDGVRHFAVAETSRRTSLYVSGCQPVRISMAVYGTPAARPHMVVDEPAVEQTVVPVGSTSWTDAFTLLLRLA